MGGGRRPADLPTGPSVPKSTVLTSKEEAIIVAFRWHTLLPLDDCLYSLQPSIPHPKPLVPRDCTVACNGEPLRRHWFKPNGERISRLPEVTGDEPARKKFKAYPIWYFHIRCPAMVCPQTMRGDFAEVQTAEV